MKCFIFLMLKKVISWNLRIVHISTLLCEQKKVAIEEGWGGRTIDYFPPCIFYRMFSDGFERKAFAAMEDWYYERFLEKRLCDVVKAHGGMRGGSLYKLIVKLHHAKEIELEKDLSMDRIMKNTIVL